MTMTNNNSTTSTKVLNFLNSTNRKADTSKTSLRAAKVDSKDVSPDAKRYVAIKSREFIALDKQLENFASKLVAEILTTYNVKVGFETAIQVFFETSVLDGLLCIGKRKANIAKGSCRK